MEGSQDSMSGGESGEPADFTA